MPNLLINQTCNRACPYCFAPARQDEQNLSFDNLMLVLDFLDASNLKDLNILGGEPTLHPEFAFFLRYLFSRNFMPRVFSNGMISRTVLDDIQQVLRDVEPQPGALRFVINVNQPGLRGHKEERQQARTFQELAAWCSQSFNIYRPDPELGFLIDNVRQYGIQPEIRMGLAQPMAGGGNQYLRLADYPTAMQAFLAFARKCDEEDIALTMDCGFALCQFDEAELGGLFKARAKLQFTCGPCIDIGPDLMVHYCYPLSQTGRLDLRDFGGLHQLARALSKLADEAGGERGITPECRDCKYRRRGQCAAGCRAHGLLALGAQG
jgi:hypothetical protein